MDSPERGLRGDRGAPRAPSDGTRDPHASAASSADPLPSEIRDRIAALPTYGMNALGTEFGGLIERDKVLAILAAADPALRTLSAKWRDQVYRERQERQTVTFASDLWCEGRLECAADLDRLCLSDQERQK